MIKVLFQLNQLGYGGTEKAILTFIKNLDKSIFQPSLFFNTDARILQCLKISIFKKFSSRYKRKFNEKYIQAWVRKDEFLEAVEERLYTGWGMKAFLRCQAQIAPNIIHFNRGLPEDFYTKCISELPKEVRVVDHNIFATRPCAPYAERIDRMLFLSHWCLKRSSWANPEKSRVLYYPVAIPPKPTSNLSLRQELGIPNDALVLGRLSRPNLDDGEVILKSLVRIFHKYPNVFFVSIGASDYFRQKSKDLSRIHCLPSTSNEARIHQFLESLDILLHYRIEGETFGLNIAEAMFRGIPVISHQSEIDNAQIELLTKARRSGVIADSPTLESYLSSIEELIIDKDLRSTLGENGRSTALSFFNPQALTRNLESIYLEILSK
jgi:glycosyltransferase involved in cell wall biosynthesis